MKTTVTVCLVVVVIAGGLWGGLAASGHSGHVTFGAVPVPGATVTASHDDTQVVTSTDAQGDYKFADLADGVWTIRVEMLGFSSLSHDVVIAPAGSSASWDLKVRPFDEMAREIAAAPQGAGGQEGAGVQGANVQGANVQGTNVQGAKVPGARAPGFQRAGVTASAGAAIAARAAPPAEAPPSEAPLGAADGLLVNGSVNNGAASPFAQLAAFGNNRRGGRSLYTGGVAAIFGSSAFDAAPFSFADQRTAKPHYDDIQVAGNIGGPLRIPGLLKSGPNMFLGFQHTSDHTDNTLPTLVPTALERIGDFSQTRDTLGRPAPIVDPKTGAPFPGNMIPRDRISPQAAALLGYYPLPNLDAVGRNYQTPTVTVTRQDALQSRITQAPFNRNQTNGAFAYQRTTTESTNAFGFTDTTQLSGVDATVNWSRRFSPFFSLRLRYQFTHLDTQVTPYFANRANVSGAAGITGNDQDPLNWGPPSLAFSSGIEGLSTAQYTSTSSQTHASSAEGLWTHGRHNVTIGGGVRRMHVDVLSQQNARGAFTFTGATTGSDLADFLLGVPQASAIAFGNPDKYLRASAYEAYVDDDWRVGPTLSLKAGLRWEYEAPFTEELGRLVNLDIAPGFSAASAVLATSPVGALTGARYPDSLLRPDRRGVQPRVGAAWRPVPGSSLVIRAGYGIYRNTNVYQSIDLLLAQQPPLSKAFSVANTPANPLSLANGFVAPAGITPNTFAVDPDFRVGFAENWQASIQRDLPGSLTVIGTYLGTRGHDLMQESLPNTYPSGAANPCPSCPAGFVYLTSHGRSSRHAAQLEVRRRLRSGLTATTRYTLAKAEDDAGAFTGVSLNGSAIAQDWLNLDREWGPSNFDQRHQLTAQVQYSSGVGVAGGTLIDGLKGALLKGWTVTSQLTVGSGQPLTPVYLTAVPGTGVTGTIRPSVTSAVAGVADGFYANPSAFALPLPGQWGSAGRNSITGPAQFLLNAGITRTFPWRERFNLDWRLDATNVLNRLTYAGVNTLFGSPQFGLPNRTNAPRKIQTTLRLRF